MDQDELKEILNKSEKFLGLRLRSTAEVRFYFKYKKSHPGEVIDQLVNYLTESGFLDDLRFAKSWTQSRLAIGKGWGVIEQELRKKGVAKEIIREVKENLDDFDTTRAIDQAYEKALRKYGENNQKLIAYLGRRGFSYSQIKEAIKKEIN
ncbi:hypothetical protein A3A70_01280 [candidate division WWE3 bacterium RIFCSPLOWO2_01_FULL_42_11]|uniref:Regulatory protein RecX n=1 Tax=candidate division WWE3 bacterium RIFCSPLOWO2_01_FULL_42_11 TaxID=1802627 RepID=A0A1F4VRF0_UNCKA|nr:MAG: hypothetical protein A3A70_01280 [candidate division WWE3 bacterium RIFCSPLOWO2_01_FULL_42_11]